MILGQAVPDILPSISTEKTLNSEVIVCAFGVTQIIFGGSVCNCGRIESVGFQLSPAYQGLGVSHLKDPRTTRTFSPIEQFAPPVDVKKDLLQKVIGLTTILKHPLSHSPDQSGVTPEKYCERIFIAHRNHSQQRFVGGLH